jgi:hypothetical protein
MRTTAAFSRHTLLALLEALLLVALISGILGAAALVYPGTSATGVGSAAAANPNRSGPSSIWLMPPAGASVAGSWPTLGSSVAFGSTYPKGTKNAWVSLTCYQGDTLVYGEGGSANATFTLGGASSGWVASPGTAVCTAELGDLYWRGGHEYYTYLAETSFDAN